MFYEKKNSSFALFVVLGALIAAPLLRAQTYDPKRVQDYIDARVDRDLNQSIIVGVISMAGERFYSAGQVSPTDARAPQSDDVFEIGSVTNTFTATAASSMVVDRQLSWLQPVNAFLPDYVETPSFGHLPLQLVHLATHTSGLPHNPPNLQPQNPADPFADYTNDHTYVAISVIGLTIPPGQEYKFSMLGYGLLGHVITLRANMSYEDLIQDRIGRPLALKETSTQPVPEKVLPGFQGSEQVPNWHWDGLVGGGGLYSSARDLLRFVSAHLQMIKLDKNDKRAFLSTQNAYKTTSMPHTMVAYGWHVTRKGLRGVYWQNGKTAGYASYIGFCPATKTGCVVLTNSSIPLDELGFYILDPDAFPLPKPPPSGVRPAKQLREYEGAYQIGPEAVLVVSREGGKLYAQIPGQPRYRVYPVGKNEFAYASGDVRLLFERTRQGVVGVTVTIGFKQLQGKKVR
ncbi:MAG: serine hydrolase [Verrucomicrobiota bacterium]